MSGDVCSLEKFFSTSLRFLKEHQWMYNYSNTHILVYKVLDQIPQEWIPYLTNITNDELNNLPFGGTNEDWPPSLKSFIKEIQDLNYNIDTYTTSCGIPELPSSVRISTKKVHEIVSLAAVVHDMCSKLDLKCIVDIGAGLGYLSQLLYDKYQYSVLAIEGNEKIYTSAVQNQEKYHSNSKSFVKYVKHVVTLESSDAIKHALQENLKDCFQDGVCITGLHACADLSVTILEIFRQLDFVKCIIIMPCCYHRLEVIYSDDYLSEERFKNFPVSDTLKVIYNEHKGWEFLRRFFLRIGCQQSKGLWKNTDDEEHAKHLTGCIFRAILQEVAEEGNLSVKRLKRRPGKLQGSSIEDNIQHLIGNIQNTHMLISKCSETERNNVDYHNLQSRLLQKWNEHKENNKLVEVLTAFQTAIQNVCENIVLLDRVCFLRENGADCSVYRVTDDTVSPRCHALIATKL